MLLSESCCLGSVGHPHWREDGSAVCSTITLWSESLRTRSHTLLSHLRRPQPGWPGCRIYIPQEHGGPVISPSIGFPLRRLLRLTGLRWRYSNLPPTWRARSPYVSIHHEQDGPVQSQSQSQSHITTDGQSISMSWCLVHAALQRLYLNEF
jgi:hypothetical protein